MMSITRRPAKPLRLFSLLAALALPVAALAQDFSLPSGAVRSYDAVRDPGVYRLPTGPWTKDAGLPTEQFEGRISVEAWRLSGTSQTPFQLAKPLRDTLEDAGYEILLDCRAFACGGFDFRFATLVLPAPEMFVDLTDYHFVAARKDGGAVSILTSRDDVKSYLQIIRAGAAPKGQTKPDAAPLPTVAPTDLGDVAKGLELTGHAVLNDVVFPSGSTQLGDGAIGSLDAIADYLLRTPDRTVMFVGHTDATGSLDANKAVSLKRAQAAVDYLRRKGVPAAQISAQGAGYLAPIASNLTEEGRRANRRVEAVLLPAR
ncbi:OmpA family protein [Tropicibacter naphthalenivorans]|uniref:Inner membrane lipoprotein YiaD n=1 Tax=Tropicibacter naphthalenivorans TaxID=441103 RepID=A0A0P1GAF1_9RHOB|nr:OmpA family protein [Tropicibacter naphthalenivorans]CUH78468.1 Inner membrane lipoprotein YiaD precursor [Tropicibacter naphthalenivorans]SMC80647.1 OmpA family protein [Tropicibacter naphthalenivorans]